MIRRLLPGWQFCLLFVLLIFLHGSAEAGRAARAVDDLLSAGGRAGSQAGRQSSAAAGLARELGLSTKAVASISRHDLEAFDDAALHFSLRNLRRTGTLGGSDELKAIAGRLRTAGGNRPTAALSSDLPFVRVALGASRADDAAILAFANLRLRKAMEESFEVDAMRVVGFGLSDDAARSAAAAARFRRGLPREVWDEVGPLANLPRWGKELSHEERVSVLMRYRGKTVVVVGHVEPGSQSFFVFRGGQKQPVDMSAWMDAAADAGVSLVPLGCHSSRLAAIGAGGKINSGDVLRRLQLLYQRKPRDMAGFLRELSGPDLVLVADPFNLRLFASGLKLSERISGNEIGMVAVRAYGRSREQERHASGQSAVNTLCFGKRSFEAFKACDERARLVVAEQSQLAQERERLERRPRQLAALKAEIATLRAKRNEAQSRWGPTMTVLGPLFALLLALIVHLSTGAAAVEQEEGFSSRRSLSRDAVLETAHALRWSADNPREGWFIFAVVAGALLCLGIAVDARWTDDQYMWLAMFGGFGGGMALNYLVAAYQLRSISVAMAAPLMIALGLTTGAIGEAGAKIAEPAQTLRWKTADYDDLRSDALTARWRKERVWIFDENLQSLPMEWPALPDDALIQAGGVRR